MHEFQSPATIRRHTARTNERVVIQNQLIVKPLHTPSIRTCSRVKRIWHVKKLKKKIYHDFIVLGFTYITCIVPCDVNLQMFISSISTCKHLFISFQVNLLLQHSPFLQQIQPCVRVHSNMLEISDSCKEQTISSSRIPTSSVMSMETYA